MQKRSKLNSKKGKNSVIYKNAAFSIHRHDNNIAELQFFLEEESINKFNSLAVNSLHDALNVLGENDWIEGLLVTSGKHVFCVGADIGEIAPVFANSGSLEQASQWASLNNDNFNRIERLPYPTCALINGFALGGGLEFALACDFRVINTSAMIGLPEVTLGLIPGWGGTVRLPRIIDPSTAMQWLASGRAQKAQAALDAGLCEIVSEPDTLLVDALALLSQAQTNASLQTLAREKKAGAISTGNLDSDEINQLKSTLSKGAGIHYPAPVKAVDLLEKGQHLDFEDALQLEAEAFIELGRGAVSHAMAGSFLSDQLVAKKAKSWAKQSDREVGKAAVLGAGIMGGGIAYQSSLKGVPVIMKDIAQAGLDQGMAEVSKLLDKQVARGKMDEAKKEAILKNIQPVLEYQDMQSVDILVEAVVENPGIKKAVLSDAEDRIREDAILASNTSTISITELAKDLQRPENFCGMHFFNPVHAMPLVEVIRGEQTSDAAVARTVAYANKLGKKAIVIKDCPGFLVNRVLFPYLQSFNTLMRDGASLVDVDAAMETWGWPMGPAYLMDVIGLDTCAHCIDVMADGFPDRMRQDFTTAIDVIYGADRLGQKNDLGFYDFVANDRGRKEKQLSETANHLLASASMSQDQGFSAEDIQMRMLLPMATELARCLEEGIVETATEADQALIYGLGFPAFRGGLFRWMDEIGMAKVAEASEKFAALGSSYQLTQGMQHKLDSGENYYGY